MLAQSFMTAAELGCDDDELSAAIKVLNMLDRGELVHCPAGLSTPGAENVRGFYMRGWPDAPRDACGTACCIGSWMEALLGRQTSFHCREAFYDLFFPRDYRTPEKFTVEAAAHAMRAKLTTGSADWSLVK